MRCPPRSFRGASLLEFGTVVIVMATLSALLLLRLGHVAHEAQRVQLRMAAEQLRLQGQLLGLRCGDDLPCRQQVLAQRRQVPGEPRLAEAPAPKNLDPLLLSVLQAAGLLALRDGTHSDWTLNPMPGTRVEVALRAQPACRLVVERHPGGLTVHRPNEC